MRRSSSASNGAEPESPPGVAPGRGLFHVGHARPLVVALDAPDSLPAERLRGVTARLMGRRSSQDRILAVVSPARGDGRSFVAANLAVMFAQAGRRTLLIDADLRQPCQHRLFQLEAGPGLSTMLYGPPDTRLVRSVDGVPGLKMLPAGGDRALAAVTSLGGERFAALLNELAASVDQIVIDTPAGGLYADAEAVAAHAGAALLLVRRQVTRIAAAKRLADDIRRSGAQIVGTLINHR